MNQTRKTAAFSAAADDGSRLPGPGDGAAAEREIYEGEGAHACDEPGCGKTFHSVAKLRRHQLTHGDRAYRCSLPGCDKRFLDFAKLKRHWFSHEGADALFKTWVDCGEAEARTVGAGLRAHYGDAAELVGARVLVLSNTKPRNLAGFKSAGMLLCSTDADGAGPSRPPSRTSTPSRPRPQASATRC